MLARIRRFWWLWRNLATIEAQAIQSLTTLTNAQRTLQDSQQALLDTVVGLNAAAEVWQAEVARMGQAANDDARLLLAYHRWCLKNGCVPSQADLNAMVRE
jgi:hypothetical protein